MVGERDTVRRTGRGRWVWPTAAVWSALVCLGVLAVSVTGPARAAPAAGGAPADVFDEAAIRALLRRVNDYQLAHPWRDTDRNWIRATWYTGVVAAYEATGERAWLDQALRWSERHRWQPGTESSGANVLTATQTYLQLHELDPRPERIDPVVEWLASGCPNTPTGARVWYREGGRRYADSLYVGPPALAMLARATGDARYLDWMHAFFEDVRQELQDPETGLFFRDERFVGERTTRGRKVIWSRGNGWVFGGLVRILRYLPEDDPRREPHVRTYRRMAQALAPRQGADGLWRTNLDDPEQYPGPESSGTGFFCYGLAWGIRHGLVDAREILPVVARAWRGLAGCVDAGGRVGWGQPVGDRPVEVSADLSHEYVTGTFLLAGSEVLRLVRAGGIPPAARETAVRPLPDAPGSWTWTPGPGSGGDEEERAEVLGRPAVRLESALRSSVDITSRFAWREVTGPLTIRVVCRPTRLPAEKTPIVSRWLMRPGGRSFELGVMPGGIPYLDVSASGSWDRQGRELIGRCRLLPGTPYAVAAVFEPGRRMALWVNGHECGTISRGVPDRIHASGSPVLLGAQPPDQRWADMDIAWLGVDRRGLGDEEIREWARSVGATDLSSRIESAVRGGRLDLARARRQVTEYCAALQVEGSPYGVLRRRARHDAEATLYATCDVAWIRACMGEDLERTLTPRQRREWVTHIHSFAEEDGTYRGGNHSLEHANGMVIGALGVLGGRQARPVRLYDAFDEPAEVAPWLERIRWDRQWSASHLFWGGMHCYSLSSRASDRWRDRVFAWLDANLDPATGWWRKGVEQSGLEIEVLGGAAHIWPMYQHHGHPFPHPRRVIDSILSMQRPDGSWLGFGNYMELDALYGLAYMRSEAPGYRETDIAAAARSHGDLVIDRFPGYLLSAPDAHGVLAVVGTLALLQELDPERFRDEARWSDIFSDRRFYRTDRVEALVRASHGD